MVLAKVQRRHQSVSRFPQVRRDLAVVVRQEVPAAAVLNTVRKAVGEHLVDIRLFDVMRAKALILMKKSALGLDLAEPNDHIIRDRNQCAGGRRAASIAAKPFGKAALSHRGCDTESEITAG
ncbi:MAG: hypothetical protein CM15mP120_10310 [Pseudomonadota bacterium]|nr:MAG: hypothetical protein CM15mP120_10310 [Pseudomonadota bacterium]